MRRFYMLFVAILMIANILNASTINVVGEVFTEVCTG